jgi:predicted esterase
MQQLKRLDLLMVLAATLIGIAGCNNNHNNTDESTTRGSLTQNPPTQVAQFSATDFTSTLNSSTDGQSLLALAGTPQCGIDIRHIEYVTVGAKGESITDTGALMVPNGSSSSCTGARPIVLYAHGTTVEKSYNIANIVDPNNAGYSESLLMAALFAAQGYIVVAPNYAGYDTSTLSYHPYLNADQQSKDMIDALSAARSALEGLSASGSSDDGRLFIAGYSQGGLVAMATQRALQELGQTVTAAAHMSGPYALEAMGDAVLTGSVNLGSTFFIPLLANGYQNAYGNVYTEVTDFYSNSFSSGISNLLPSSYSNEELIINGLLPQTALFSSTTPSTGDSTLDDLLAIPSSPLFALGFGDPYLINNSVRTAYALDIASNPDGFFPTPTAEAKVASSSAYGLREDLRINDMRYDETFSPASPTLLCGGHDDPTVYFFNAQAMQAFWAPYNLPDGLLTVLDLETGLGSGDPYTTLESGFAELKTQIAAEAVTAGATDGGVAAVATSYHGTLVQPFCTAAARGFFTNF